MIQVITLGDKGAKAGRCKEIELSDFDPSKHELVGTEVGVTVARNDFHEKVSSVLKGIIAGQMNMSFGKVLKAIDPGSAYPVYQVEVRNNGVPVRFWLPKIACDIHVSPSSIRKSLGGNTVSAAA